MIHEVYEDGAAAKDGRLWAGDQILEVRLRYVVVFVFFFVVLFMVLGLAKIIVRLCKSTVLYVF